MEDLIPQDEGMSRKDGPLRGGMCEIVNKTLDGCLLGDGGKEVVCVTRSDSMSIDSTSENELASAGGAPEEMDTEDSEKDTQEGFGSELRDDVGSRFVDGKEAHAGMRLLLDNQNNVEIMESGTTGIVAVQGDVTSPVIENKLSDDVQGYYVMRTRLFSQSAVILENGAALKKDNTTGLSGSDRANSNYESDCCKDECEKSVNTLSIETDHRDVNHSSDAELECVDRLSPQEDERINEPSEGGNFEGYGTQPNSVPSTQEGGINDCVASNNEESGTKSDGNELSVVKIKVEPADEDECSSCIVSIPLGEAEESIGATASSYIMDSSASESIAEVEKNGLEAKLARVSKRRVYSKVREVSKDAESSSESDSDSESEDEEKESLPDLYEAKVLINVAQPDSQKIIKRETMKMACADDLLSDYITSEDSSASSTDSSSGDSDSESDDSSESDLSSVESEEEPEDRKRETQRRGLYPVKTVNEITVKDLPEVEYVDITLPEGIELKPLGCVSSIIGSLVIIQAERGTPALNVESVLFKDDRKVFGQVFEIFGPVVSPFYSIRFNSVKDIEEKGIILKTLAYYAPQHLDMTQYVFAEKLIKQHRGSDASWKNDEEPPDEFVDYSDDEDEKAAKNKRTGGKDKRKRKVPQGRQENGSAAPEQRHVQGPFVGQRRMNGRSDQDAPWRSHPPLQRHPPIQRHPAPQPRPFLCSSLPPGPHPGMFNQPPLGASAFQDQQTHIENPAFRPSNVRGQQPGSWGTSGSWGPTNGEFPLRQFDKNYFRPRQPFGSSFSSPRYQFSGPPQPMFQNPLVSGPPGPFGGMNSMPDFNPLSSGGGLAQQQHGHGGNHRNGGSHSNQQGKQKQSQKFTARQGTVPPPWLQTPPPPPPHSSSMGRPISAPGQMNGVPPMHGPHMMKGPMASQSVPHKKGMPPMKSAVARSGFDSRFRPSKMVNQLPTTNLPPPPVPPPSFHPKMMQSFGGQQSYGGSQR